MIRFIHGILREVKEDMLVIEAGGLDMGFAFLLLFLIKHLRLERKFFFIPTFRFERIVRSFSAFGRKGIGIFSSNYFLFPALALRLPWEFYPV